jgi:hypothetical protein
MSRHDLHEIRPQIPDALVLQNCSSTAVGDVTTVQHKVIRQRRIVGSLLLDHGKAERNEGALVGNKRDASRTSNGGNSDERVLCRSEGCDLF